MKRKIIGGSFLLLLIISLCLSFLLSRKMIIPQNISAPVAAIEEIIAPAILDSGNDMTHVPSIQSGIVKR